MSLVTSGSNCLPYILGATQQAHVMPWRLAQVLGMIGRPKHVKYNKGYQIAGFL